MKEIRDPELEEVAKSACFLANTLFIPLFVVRRDGIYTVACSPASAEAIYAGALPDL